MHISVKHHRAWRAMEVAPFGVHHLHMPPVAKPSRKLGRHYLREWREHRSLTQEQAAEMLGMDRTNLSKIERTLVPYTQELLEAAARAYSCRPEELISAPPDNPTVPWASLWDTLDQAQQRRAVRMLRALAEDDDVKAA